VLKHIVFPADFLSIIESNLDKDWVLVIEVPNEVGDFIYQEKGGTPFYEPHITFFNMKTLLSFIEKNVSDFTLLYAGTTGRCVSEEKEHRRLLKTVARGFLRRILNIYPPLLGKVRGLYGLLNAKGTLAPIALSDHDADEERLYFRVILKKN